MNKLLLSILGVTAVAAPMAGIALYNPQEEVSDEGISIYSGDHDHGPIEEEQGAIQYNFKLEAGQDHIVALTEDGHLYTWGSNELGQLGVGLDQVKITSDDITDVHEGETITIPNENVSADPIELDEAMFGGNHVVDIAAGDYHTVVLTETGDVYHWGHYASTGITIDTPTLLATDADKVFAGYGGAAYISGHDVYLWGENTDGQLGLGHNNDVTTPENIGHLIEPDLTENDITAVEFGVNHTAFLGEEHLIEGEANGAVFVSGSNASGQLADGTNTSVNTPKVIEGVEYGEETTGNVVVSDVALGDEVTYLTLNTGEVMSAGSNDNGLLGNGNITDSSDLVMVEDLTEVNGIETNGTLTFATTEDGHVFTWGGSETEWANMSEDMTVKLTPTEVHTLEGEHIIFTTVMDDSSFAVTAEGQVIGFGSNAYGQMGQLEFHSFVEGNSVFYEYVYKFENSLLYTTSPMSPLTISLIAVFGSIAIIIPSYLIIRNWKKSRATKEALGFKKEK